MSYDREVKLLEDLLAVGSEENWLEYKTNVGKKNYSLDIEELGNYISALSNSACISGKQFGYLVLGVSDLTLEIVGTNFDPKTARFGNQDFELRLRSMIRPRLHFEILQFFFNHKNIVVFEIPAAKGEATSYQNRQLIRINSHVTELTHHPDLLRKIYNSHSDWSGEIIENADLTDLDEEAIKVARTKYIEKSKDQPFVEQIEKWDDLTFLDKARLTKGGRITTTSLILLGKPEAAQYLSPYRIEITWKLDTDQKAYEHFGMPFLLNTSKVLQRIRNYQYKFFPDTELLSTTINKYEPRVILEALHNAIAHQDYTYRSRIIVTEQTSKLIFENSGGFYLGKPEDYFFGEKTPSRYRNDFLVAAMVNVGMIDTIGYGIHTMLVEQRKRFLPLPDYNKSTEVSVLLEIYGQEIDLNFSKILIERKSLELSTVILLDKFQKKQPIEKKDLDLLKKMKLVQGRYPDYYLSSSVTIDSPQKVDFIKNRAFDDRYFKDLILSFLAEYGQASRGEIDLLLIQKLPDILDIKKKKNKIRNMLFALSKKEGKIFNCGTQRKPVWKLSKV